MVFLSFHLLSLIAYIQCTVLITVEDFADWRIEWTTKPPTGFALFCLAQSGFEVRHCFLSSEITYSPITKSTLLSLSSVELLFSRSQLESPIGIHQMLGSWLPTKKIYINNDKQRRCRASFSLISSSYIQLIATYILYSNLSRKNLRPTYIKAFMEAVAIDQLIVKRDIWTETPIAFARTTLWHFRPRNFVHHFLPSARKRFVGREKI